MKYSKLFNNHFNYNDYITGQDKVLPNVSYCRNENEVHYNPWTDPRVIAKFNVTSTSEATSICLTTQLFSEIEIDGITQSSVVDTYTFDTTGEHTIKYTLVDPTTIGVNAFYGCIDLTNITIPNSVTTIGNNAFYQCTSLTNVVIPNSVTSIGQMAFTSCSGLTSVTIGSGITSIGRTAFGYCSSLISVTVQAITPPTLGTSVFEGTNNCPIYVPSASVNTYKTATNWSSLASRIQAIQ